MRLVSDERRSTVHLSAENVQRLAEHARSGQTGLLAVLVTLSGVLVHRYVGWDIIAIGMSPDHGVSLLPLNFADDPPLVVALGRAARALTAESGEIRRLWLQSEQQLHSLVPRSMARTTTGATTPIAICLSIANDESGVHVTCEGNGIADSELVGRLARHFGRLAKSAAAAPHARVSQLELLDPSEYRQFVVDWNSTECEHSSASLHELFDVQAAATPNAPALRCAGQSLTYRQLQTRANQLAHYLRARGVRLESRVGVCLERSIDAVVAILAVLKAGGMYVPIDPGYPPARVSEMLADCAPVLVVTREEHRGVLAGIGVPTVLLDAEADAITTRPASSPPVVVTSANAAYILYTVPIQ